jgi:hypothetical protein
MSASIFIPYVFDFPLYRDIILSDDNSLSPPLGWLIALTKPTRAVEYNRHMRTDKCDVTQ